MVVCDNALAALCALCDTPPLRGWGVTKRCPPDGKSLFSRPNFGTERRQTEYSSGSLALQDDLYTPSTHTSLESPRNGGINGYFTLEHGLLQGEPSIITSKWGYSDPNGGFITPDTHILSRRPFL
jgi:hypothetical protein